MFIMGKLCSWEDTVTHRQAYLEQAAQCDDQKQGISLHSKENDASCSVQMFQEQG